MAAVVARMHVARVPLLRTTLCLVFACMVHIDARGLLACLQVRRAAAASHSALTVSLTQGG